MDARRDPQEWFTPLGQRQRALSLVTRRELLDQARYYAALANLVANEDFQMVLEHLTQRLLLTARAHELRQLLFPGTPKQDKQAVGYEEAALYRLGRDDRDREFLEDVRLAPEHSVALATRADQL